jgi:hypothetical protein
MLARRSLLSFAAGAFVASALVACSSTSTSSGTGTAPTTTAAPSTAVTSLPPTTTPPTTTQPPVTEGGIVKVANCSDVNGAAGVLSDELAGLGFEMRKATNGAGLESTLDTTKIYVVPGAEAVARSISRLLGGVELFAMPVPAWIQDGTAGLGDATVLVMLGHDLAGKHLADMAG